MLRKLRLLNDERGQSIVTIGLMSIFILGILGVVADTGFTWLQRRNLQNSADAAALAAAQALPDDESGANTLAQSYVTKNGGGTTTVEFGDRISSGPRTGKPLSVKVTVHKNSESLFGVSLGFGNLDVNAKAKAKVRSAQTPGVGVNPIGILQSEVVPPGTSLVLKDPGGGGSTGNYGLVAFCDPVNKLKCTGTPVVCDGLEGGASGVWDPGTQTQPGNKGAIRSCVYDRMTAAQANNCFTLAQILDSNNKLIDRCNPIIGATKGSLAGYPNVQPTSVILIPILDSATWPGGTKGVPLVQDGTGQRIFAFFAMLPATVQTTNGVPPTCVPPSAGGTGQCDITGVFVQALHAAVGASGQPVGDYTDQTVVKVVQLVE